MKGETMRNYLFRGKTYDGRWVYGSLILAGNYCCILESEENVHPMDYPYLDNDLGFINGKATPVIRETVGMYTERNDKNNKQIFEDDIVRGLMDWGPAGMAESVVTIGFKKSVGGYRWNYFDVDTIEVIGNVYDNSDLLDNLPQEELIEKYSHLQPVK
jgi:hypothetical protein